jgi:hypothetical protein
LREKYGLIEPIRLEVFPNMSIDSGIQFIVIIKPLSYITIEESHFES